MTMVFDRYPVGGAERLLALAIADHAHDDGTHIFPAIDTLAHKTMQSRSTVQRQIAKMVASGWLVRMGNRTGRGYTNEYRIAPGWIDGELLPSQVVPPPVTDAEASYPQAGQSDTLSPGEKGVIQNEKGVTTDAKGVTAMTPESSEPSKNHTPLPPDGGADGFETLWSIYPNHDGRAKAERRYRRLAPSAALQQTMRSAIEAQRLSKRWTKDGGEYVPAFATWLRDERWLDGSGASGTACRAWQETRAGIDAKARELCIPAWDEVAFSLGRGPSYPAFTERVVRAAEAREAACA